MLVGEDRASLGRIAQLLTTFHAQWWGEDSLTGLPWLRDGTTARGPEWVEDRRDRFRARHGSLRSDLADQLVDNAAQVLHTGSERLQTLPATLAHGDVHLDNVLFVSGEPILLDWAGCRRGPALPDLTAVVFGMAEPDNVANLLETYREALREGGVDLPHPAFDMALGGAVLWSFVYWTLGTARWIPTNDREAAMQGRHIADAVAMIERWAERDPTPFEEVLG